MARNKYDIDEVLETPFDIRHLKRSLVYVARYKKKIAQSLLLSAAGIISGCSLRLSFRMRWIIT